MLSEFSLVLLLGSLFGLFGKDRQDMLAQRAVFFSSGEGGASGR
jgi:hypothetical protein